MADSSALVRSAETAITQLAQSRSGAGKLPGYELLRRAEDFDKAVGDLASQKQDESDQKAIARAMAFLDDNMPLLQQAELLARFSDRCTNAEMVMNPEAVILAMLQDALPDKKPVPSALDDDGLVVYDNIPLAVEIYAWAFKLKDRHDWDEMLEMAIGEYTLLEWLAFVLYYSDVHHDGENLDEACGLIGVETHDVLEVYERFARDAVQFDRDDLITAMEGLSDKLEKIDDSRSDRSVHATLEEAEEEAGDALDLV